jgi:hypothetical protein
MLLLKAEQYQLSNPQNILLIMGTEAIDQIAQNYAIWDRAKNDLYSCAKVILSKNNLAYNDQLLLVNAVRSFRSAVEEQHKNYTSVVISKLQTILFSPARPATLALSEPAHFAHTPDCTSGNTEILTNISVKSGPIHLV